MVTGAVSMACCAQSIGPSLGIWHFRAISGELDLRGQYRQLASQFNELTEDQRSTYFLGGVKLNTSSYLWDPDIIRIDLNGAFSPETRDEKYITIPDRSEVRTLKKVDILTTLFQNKPLEISGFFNFDQNYYNRELLTNVRSSNSQWGSRLAINNRILPLTLSYRNTDWDQEETQTGRRFTMNREDLETRASKSFSSRDRSELIYSHNNYLYNYADLHQTEHRIDRVALNNNIYLDSARKYNLNSRITWHNQEGTNSFRRFEVLEGVSFQMPHNLRLMANFNLFNLADPVQVWDQKRTRATIQHQLYKSLTSKAYVEYARVRLESDHIYNETDIRSGIDLIYSKKIPTGHLNLSYRYYRLHHSTDGVTGLLSVLNEEHILRDGELTLLDKPYVDVASVVVKDGSGTLVYQANFDYLLLERAGFVEIQRIPGGLIPDNGTVNIDYTYTQPGSYNYAANNNHFSASILLFGRLVELYYRFSVQNYPRIFQGDLLTLNYFTQHVYGARLDLGFVRGGIESDIYSSSLIPYKMWRYYMDMNWNIRSRILLNVNGNVRDYRMIADEVDQLYSSFSGRIAYRLPSQMTVSLESGYLNQRGQNIDLDLLTARAEFHAVFNRLHARVGIEMYRRMYQDSDFAFNGAYVQLTRKF